jgi:hypothetical protein
MQVHAVVETHGLPVYLALTPGEAHEDGFLRLSSARCPHKRCDSRIVDMTRGAAQQ